MSASQINRSLATVRTELDFLRESNVISQEIYDMVNQSLPQNASNKGGEYMEALYQFDPQQDGDLALSPGDKIEVLEKPSNEWFKGRCNGRVGMFPANYVKAAYSGSDRPSVPPPPQYEQAQRTNTGQSSGSYQQPFPPPSTNYYQQPPQQYQQPQQQQPQQEQQQQHHSHNHLKKFGSKLGNAAIFGAGATMGSDLVNSIFWRSGLLHVLFFRYLCDSLWRKAYIYRSAPLNTG